MIYLGSDRIITNNFSNHISAEDYAGSHLSDVSINSTCKVINIVNKFKSHEDSINYNDFLNNQNNWKNGSIYNCISITGKIVQMNPDELGGNQIHLETIYNNEKYIIKLMHLNDVIVNIGDIIYPNQVIAHQGNTGLVLSSKSINDVTYGSHVHIEVTDKNNNFINPRGFADGSISGTYIKQSNELNNNTDQIKILVDAINIREQASINSNNIGKVYLDELYDVLEIMEDDTYIWYKIKTNTEIIGYIASKKDENWIQFTNKKIDDKVEDNLNIDLELIFTCIKDDYYYLKLYNGESLYIRKETK